MTGTKPPSLTRRLKRIADRFFGASFDSKNYWERRYKTGGNSGSGSYNHLALFKASVLNDFVAREQVKSVIEFGCGDGNQLKLANYPRYTGYDVSESAVTLCRELFSKDDSKDFALVSEYDGRQADLTLSLDVLFHLVEDGVYERYMSLLFDASRKWVGIYSSNTDQNPEATPVAHVRHRTFTRWVETHRPDWQLVEHVPNKYPFDGDFTKTSFADFYFFRRA